LLGGIVTAIYADNLLHLFKYFISLPAVFGAAIWLGFVWRRLTRTAVITQVVICFTLYAVIPNVFPLIRAVRTHPALTVQTTPREVVVVTGALQEDVDAGRASQVGESIRKAHRIEATGIFFDNVVRVDPDDPRSPVEGRGRFNAEIWVLSALPIDLASWTKAQLVAVRFFFDALFPFVLLFAISPFTRAPDERRLDRFYGRLHTPVQSTMEEDEAAVEHAARHPESFESRKIWRRSSWEILKPGRLDVIGFGGSWVVVVLILILLWQMARIGS
ncbi:MAG: hypothetical protein PVI01_15770, partial [Gemmatimonadales bacterium]